MATSYANPGGSGDRTASITVSTTLGVTGTLNHLVNGNLTETDFFYNGEAVSGKEVKFDFGPGASKIIDSFKWKQSTDNAQGNWKWFASNDDSSYSALGAAFDLTSFVAGAIKEFTEPAGNTTGYRYYKMVGQSGSTSSSPWVQEIEFKIDDALVVGFVHSIAVYNGA